MPEESEAEYGTVSVRQTAHALDIVFIYLVQPRIDIRSGRETRGIFRPACTVKYLGDKWFETRSVSSAARGHRPLAGSLDGVQRSSWKSESSVQPRHSPCSTRRRDSRPVRDPLVGCEDVVGSASEPASVPDHRRSSRCSVLFPRSISELLMGVNSRFRVETGGNSPSVNGACSRTLAPRTETCQTEGTVIRLRR